MAQCPHCKTEMKLMATKNRKVVVDKCPNCSGLWLDDREIDSFIKDKAGLRDFYQTGLQNTMPGNRECPRCHTQMSEGTFPGSNTKIDHCNQCGGIFTDSGELQAIVSGSISQRSHVRSRKAAKLPAFAAQVLDSDEEVIWSDVPNKTRYFIQFLSLPMILAFMAFYGTFTDSNAMKLFINEMLAGNAVPVGLWIFTIILIPFIIAYFRYRNIVYVLTNKRIIITSGLLGIDFRSIDYSKITDITVNVSVIDKFFRTGTIRIHTASGEIMNPSVGYSGRALTGVENPYILYKRIKSLSYRKN